MVYADLEPFGYRMDNWRAGMVASTILNVNRSKRTSKTFKPEDCMPKEKRDVDPHALAEKIRHTMRHVALMHKHKDKQAKGKQ